MRVQLRIYIMYLTVVTNLLITGESLKYKSSSIFQMDSRKAKLSQFIFIELFFDNAGDLVLSSQITNMQQKALPKKTLDKLNSFFNLLTEHRSL